VQSRDDEPASGERLKMKEPLVSIMMITYNQASFIVQAIEGGLNQKVSFPFEFV